MWWCLYRLFMFYPTLLRAKEVGKTLWHSHIPVVFEMERLLKAIGIVLWSGRQCERCNSCGRRHVIVNVDVRWNWVSVLGLWQLLSDSDVYASSILKGKYFDRGLIAFNQIDEASCYRPLRNFEAWCERYNKDINCDVTEMMSTFRSTELETNIQNHQL